MMTYWGIEMKTMKEETTSKIAELLIKGTNMGIKELKKLNRKELLEILLEQAKVIEKLENDFANKYEID